MPAGEQRCDPEGPQGALHPSTCPAGEQHLEGVCRAGQGPATPKTPGTAAWPTQPDSGKETRARREADLAEPLPGSVWRQEPCQLCPPVRPAGAAVSPWAGHPASEPPCLHAAGFLSAEPNLPGNGSFDGRVARTLPGASEARAALRTRARALQKCIKSCSENRAAWRGPTPFHAQGVGDDGATRQSPFSGWSSGTWTGHASGRR